MCREFSNVVIDTVLYRRCADLQHHLGLAGTLALLGKDDAAHLEDALKALAALDGVLLESVDQGVLDAVLDALPAAAEGGDAGALDKLGLVGAEGLVDNLFLDVDEVAPGQVLADHGDGAVGGVDVAGLVDEALVHLAADDGLDPVGGGLAAGNEALGAEDAGGRVDGSREGVDGDDVLRLVVPGAILLPVGRGDLVPRVVEGDGVGKDLHFDCIDGREVAMWERMGRRKEDRRGEEMRRKREADARMKPW